MDKAEKAIVTLVRLGLSDEANARPSFEQFARNLTAHNNHVVSDECKAELKPLVPIGNPLRGGR